MSPPKSVKIIDNNNKNIFEICLNQFKELTKHSESFLNVQNEKANDIKILLKSLYDYIKSSSDSKNGISNSLPELIIDEMDEEQIWQQLELHNEEIDDKVVTEISKLSVVKRDQIDWNLHLSPGDNNVVVEGDYDADETLDNERMDDELGSTDEMDSSEDDIDENDYKDEFDDDEDHEDEDAHKTKKNINDVKIKEKFKSTVVDDKFFKLREMEKFLDAEDEKEMKKIKGEGAEANSDEDEIDYFADSSDDDEDDENEEDDDYEEDEEDSERKNDKNSKFADFFDDEEEENNEFIGANDREIDDDADENDNEELEEENVPFKNNRYKRGPYLDYEEEEKNRLELRAEKLRQANEELKKKKQELGIEDNESDESNEGEKSKSKVRFNLNKNSYLSDNDSNVDDEEEETSKKGKKKKTREEDESKSTFEKRQERLKHRIENLEEAALNEKPWQLKGEIKASSRPRNSLLEEVLEFDATTRPAPIITEDTTLRLEDIIKQRIKDKAFDSVVKKYKPINTPQEYRKKLVLDQEKSKESLSQIYEKEYLKQLDAANPNSAEKEEEEPKEHKEVREMMTILMAKLNALSNFHFTPKPAIPEAKIMTNLPAINIEEVAPVSVSDAAMLAPEEIRKPVKGDVMGKDERTRTDKNRQRRQKKLKQKSIKHYEEKKEKDLAEKGLELNKKDSNKKLLDKVTKSRNVEKMTVTDGKSLKSSKVFFSQLQDEVTKQVKSKTKDGLKRKQKTTEITAKKLKL